MALQDIEVSQVQIDNKEYNIADTAVRQRVTVLENSGFITLNDLPIYDGTVQQGGSDS